MVLPVEGLKKIVECDDLLTEATREKNTLAGQKTILGVRKSENVEHGVEVSESLQKVTEDLAAATAELTTIVDEDELEQKQIEVHSLSATKIRLQRAQRRYAGMNAVEREHELRNLDALIAEKDLLITEVQARKAELEALTG